MRTVSGGTWGSDAGADRAIYAIVGGDVGLDVNHGRAIDNLRAGKAQMKHGTDVDPRKEDGVAGNAIQTHLLVSEMPWRGERRREERERGREREAFLL